MNIALGLLVFVLGVIIAGYLASLFPPELAPTMGFLFGMPVGPIALFIAMDDYS